MEEEKLRSAASMDNSYTKMLFSSNVPLIGKAWYLQVRARTLPNMCQKIIYIYLHPYLRELWQGRTNSTVLLKQPNSLEVDRAALRKTKSEENMGCVAPKIIIGKLLTTTNINTFILLLFRQGLPRHPRASSDLQERGERWRRRRSGQSGCSDTSQHQA